MAGSLVAILALAGTARWLRLGESRLDDAGKAREIAEGALVGFRARAALLGQDGGAAIVSGNGAVALLKRHGARVAVRRLIPPLDLAVAVEGVTVDSGERWFGRVTLTGVIADEVRAIEAQAQLPTIH